MTKTSVAIVGKSALFPASQTPKAFWPNVLAMKGLMPGLAGSHWPFSGFFTESDLKKLKGFVMNSGLLSMSELPADGFEIPADVLRISQVLPVMALLLSKQALEDTTSFSSGKIPPQRVGVIFQKRSENLLIREFYADAHRSAWTKTARAAGVSDELIEKTLPATPPVLPEIGKILSEKFASHYGCMAFPGNADAPLPGTFGLIEAAVRLLQKGDADLIITGGIDETNPVFSFLSALSSLSSSPLASSAPARQETRFSEGMGMLALRRLEDAERDGDRIYAVISNVSAHALSFASPASKAGVAGAGTVSGTYSPSAAPVQKDASPAETKPKSMESRDIPSMFADITTDSGKPVREIPWTLSLSENPWIQDHKPNYVIPALPLMCSLDWITRTLEQETGSKITGISRLEATQWIAFDEPTATGSILCQMTETGTWRIDLKTLRNGKMIRAVAAECSTDPMFSAPETSSIPPLADAVEKVLPYQTHEVSHGMSFHLMEQWKLGTNGASLVVRNASRGVPIGTLNPSMLDAALHGIPWTHLTSWFPKLSADAVGYPVAIENMRICGPIPVEGTTQVEIRVIGIKGLPKVQLWLYYQGSCFTTFRLSLFSLPLGHFASLTPFKRRAFFRDRRYALGASVAETSSEESHVERHAFQMIDWLPNTLSRLYHLPANSPDLYHKILRAEHLSQHARLHPSEIVYDADAQTCRNLPFNPIHVTIEESGDRLSARGAPQASLDWKKVRECWVKHTGPRRFFHDLLGALFGTFVSRVVLQKPDEFMGIASRPVVYVANHQIGLESPLFMALSYAMTALPIQAVAKPDHVNAWLAFLLAFAQDSLGGSQPFRLMYFDKMKPMGLIESLKSGTQDASLLVHVEGTRAMEAGQPVMKMSSVFLDMAIEKNIPLVPVRFVGGLPAKAITERLDFPFGNGKQDYIIGAPIYSDTLKALRYGQRPKFVMDQINNLGPLNDEDTLLPPNKKFEEKTRFFMETFGFPKMQAMLFAILGLIDDPCEETAVLIKAVQSGKLDGSGGEIPPVLKNFLTHVKTKFS
ncbi:MAG: beta-ketoacyl synthase N-terminal-like domain-containing protein [Candidatus Ozemobacteraceae bacterium]